MLAFGDEVDDLWLMLLPVTVNTAITLLKDHQ